MNENIKLLATSKDISELKVSISDMKSDLIKSFYWAYLTTLVGVLGAIFGIVKYFG